MTAELRRSLALAMLGLLIGLGLVFALFGGDHLHRASAPAEAPADAGQGSVAALSPRADLPAAGPERQATIAPGAGLEVEAGKGGAGPDGAASPGSEATGPTFDVVRVEPDGEAVVGGRGAPNTVVELLVDGRSVARALTDANGQFALVPPALPVGSSEIVLRSITADGRETRSKESVAVMIARTRDTKPLVALTSQDKPTVVLSRPEAAPDVAEAGSPAAPRPTAEARPGTAPVAIASVDAQEGGRLHITGSAPAGATVRLYLNDTLIAPASVGSDGAVTLTIGRGVKPGAYTVRIDQVDPVSGKVRSRAEVPFTVPDPASPVATRKPGSRQSEPAGASTFAQVPDRPRPMSQLPASERAAPADPARPGGVFLPEINTARISRGDSLWQISRRTYGKGDRYTVIYDANQEQIRNPDLIYPGQIFVLPGDSAGKAARRG